MLDRHCSSAKRRCCQHQVPTSYNRLLTLSTTRHGDFPHSKSREYSPSLCTAKSCFPCLPK